MEGTTPNLAYIAPAESEVQDQFTFTVSDGRNTNRPAKVEIHRHFARANLQIPKGFALIHLPFEVMAKVENGQRSPVKPVASASHLYNLIGSQNVNFLIC